MPLTNATLEETIPTELKLMIFSFLTKRELGKAAQVSKNWNNLASQNELWLRQLIEETGLQKDEINYCDNGEGYKKTYAQLISLKNLSKAILFEKALTDMKVVRLLFKVPYLFKQINSDDYYELTEIAKMNFECAKLILTNQKVIEELIENENEGECLLGLSNIARSSPDSAALILKTDILVRLLNSFDLVVITQGHEASAKLVLTIDAANKKLSHENLGSIGQWSYKLARIILSNNKLSNQLTGNDLYDIAYSHLNCCLTILNNPDFFKKIKESGEESEDDAIELLLTHYSDCTELKNIVENQRKKLTFKSGL